MKEKGKIYYNLDFRICQLFACENEALIFGEIKFWHSFPYYLEDFFEKFFRIDKLILNKFEFAIKNRIDNINRKIYENNLKSIETYMDYCKKKLSTNDLLQAKNDLLDIADSEFIRLDIKKLFK